MPFYCDLIDLAVKADGKIPPELVPYTQALYYDETGQTTRGNSLAENSEDFGKEDYKLLMVAPWEGRPSNRMASVTLKWGGKDALSGVENSGRIGALYGEQIDNDLARAQRLVNDAKRALNEASIAGRKNGKDYLSELAKSNSFLRAALYFFREGDETWTKINNTISAIDNLQTNTSASIESALSRIKEIAIGPRRVNKKSDNTDESGKQGNAKNSIGRGTTNPIEIRQTEDDFKVTLNQVGAGVTSDDFYGSGNGHTIEKSIVCKSSDTKSAYNCLVELANYLGIVAPRFSYVGATDKDWSVLSISINPPNNFRMQPTQNAKSGGVNIISTTDNKNTSYNFNLFKYRGEFQLRQGYTIYRNLVPSEVIVTASPDMIFLSENPFTFDSKLDKNASEQEKVRENQRLYSEMMAPNTHASASVDVANEILSAWKASNLCRKITLYDGKEGYLFPQWLNIKITLISIEPYDGVTATQQLFCYSDKELKTGG